jgi:hydrogenase maturation protease
MSEPDLNPSRRDLLVIGYGNDLRGDDGVGRKVAEAVAELNLPGVRIITDHQLAPEMSDPVSQARLVIFVDAAVDATEVQLRKLEPAATGRILTHAPDPRAVLALARDVFGRCPEAWWLTIPIQSMEFGEELTPLARQGFARAIEEIRRLSANA